MLAGDPIEWEHLDAHTFSPTSQRKKMSLPAGTTGILIEKFGVNAVQ